jgi:MFS family permease
VLLGISVFLNYIDRGNLSIAAPMLKNELRISASHLGILLSAFFWTYACMQPISGWLVDRFNVNWLMAAGFFVWSASTAATGYVHTLTALFVVRLILGIGESVAYPSYSKIIALNFHEQHRGLANSVVSAGLLLGPGIGIILGGTLMARFGWRPFFIGLGLVSLLWLVPWIKLIPPAQAPAPRDSTGIPTLSEFLRLRSAWGTFIGLFCGNYVNYFLITWLPFYLVRERHFSLNTMAQVGGTAYLLAAGFTVLSGWLSDRWILSGGSPSLVRKTFTAGGLALSGISLFLVSVSGPRSCVVFVILGVIGIGISASNLFSITQRLAGPTAAGRWTGFQCCIGNLSGIVAPAVTGFVVQRTGHFYWAFVILAAVAMIGVLIWIFLVGPVEPVVWHTKPHVAAAAT